MLKAIEMHREQGGEGGMSAGNPGGQMCLDCFFWHTTDDAPDALSEGECRRYPPSVMLIAEVLRDGTEVHEQTGVKGVPLMAQPTAYGEEWCGEWVHDGATEMGERMKREDRMKLEDRIRRAGEIVGAGDGTIEDMARRVSEECGRTVFECMARITLAVKLEVEELIGGDGE